MRKCADMKYHFAAKLRIYPSSEQKHMIAVNDGVSRYVYNRMTANDRDLHAMKKAADMCPAYRERVAYLEQVRSSKKELVNTIPFLNEKNVDSLAVDNAIKNHNLAWKRFREVPGTGIPGFHKKSYEQSYQTNAHYRKGAASWEDGNVHFVKRSAGEQVPHLITLPMLGAIRFRCSGKVLYMLTSHKEDTRIGTITVRRDNCDEEKARKGAAQARPDERVCHKGRQAVKWIVELPEAAAPHGRAPAEGIAEQGGLPAGTVETAGRKPRPDRFRGPEGEEPAQEPQTCVRDLGRILGQVHGAAGAEVGALR